jgi:hypothetical protein
VFVSSTYQDLTGYRAAVTRAILTGENVPDDMLYWPAEEDRALDASLRRVRASGLVVLILAHRYGTVPSGAQASITELEINEALACNIYSPSLDVYACVSQEASDPRQAQTLLNKGRKAEAAGNRAEVERAVRDLWRLLPTNSDSRALGFDSGVR